MKTNNPKKWGKNNPFTFDNLKLYFDSNNLDSELLKIFYIKNQLYLQIKCSCGKLYQVSLNNFMRKNQYVCPSCGRKRSSEKHKKIDKVIKELDRKNLKMIGDYTGIKYSYYFLTEEGYYIKSVACNLSTNKKDQIFSTKNDYSYYNMIHFLEINSPGVKLLDNSYQGTKYSYNFLCKCGKKFKLGWQYVCSIKKIRCPSCSKFQSSFEFKMEQYLIDNNIKYEKQKSFNECRDKLKLPFDFYLPEYKTIIEVDGEQHYLPVRFSSKISEEEALIRLDKTKTHDKIKNEYCKNNKIKIIRIPYWMIKDGSYTFLLENLQIKN